MQTEDTGKIVEKIDLQIGKSDGTLTINIQCPKCKHKFTAFWEFKRDEKDREGRVM